VWVPETGAGPPDVIALPHRKTMDFVTGAINDECGVYEKVLAPVISLTRRRSSPAAAAVGRFSRQRVLFPRFRLRQGRTDN
jgi:hypothetical protein